MLCNHCRARCDNAVRVQVKLPISSASAAQDTVKTPLPAPLDSIAAPGFSGEGDSCRTVLARTDGPVPAKVLPVRVCQQIAKSLKSGSMVLTLQNIVCM